jgi:TP901 family phage tail tape measure protein
MTQSANVAVSVTLKTNGQQDVQKATDILRQLAATGANINATFSNADPLKGLRNSAQTTADAWGKLQTIINATAIAGGFKAVATEAIKFESAIADVAKVLDGGGAAAQKVRADIENLAKVLPVTQQGLAQIAAAGASAGVGLAELPAYIETTAKASTAFGMTAEETGQAFGNLNAIYKLSQTELRLLADAINYVGNNSATSERNVIDVAQRVGALATVAGVSKEQLLALAGGALPALGNRSELAASALEALIGKLSAAGTADKKVKDAFKQMGLEAGSFAKLLQTDAVGALEKLKGGLDGFNATGKQGIVKAIFGENYDGQILAILGNLDQARSLMTGLGDATKYAGGLNDEFAQKAKTTENQLTLLGNQVRQAAINLGDAFLPAINDAAKSLTPLINAVASFARENPAFVQSLTLAVGALVALRTATLAANLLWPGLVAGLTGAAAASTGAAAGASAAAGAFTRMQVAASRLLRVLGGIPVAIMAVAAAMPFLNKEFDRASTQDKAIEGTSQSLEDAVEGWQNLRFEKEKLDRTYKDDKGSEVYRANLARMDDSINKAAATVARLRGERKKQQDQEATLAKAQADAKAAADEAAKVLAGNGKDYVPPEGGGSTGGSGDAEARAAEQKAQELARLNKQYSEARERSLQASEDATLIIQRASSSAAEAELDASLQRRLITTADYEARKLALQKQAIDAEDDVLNARLSRDEARLDALREQAQGTGKEATEAAIEVEQVSQRITATAASLEVNEQKRLELERRTSTTLYQVEQRITAARAQLGEQLLTLQGKELDAANARIKESRRQFDQSDEGQDPQAKALRDQIDGITELRNNFQQAERDYSNTTERLRLKQQELQEQYDQGILTTTEYNKALRDVNRQYAAELQGTLDKLEALQAALAEAGVEDASLNLKVANIKASLRGLTTEVDAIAKSINEAFSNSILDGLTGLISGTMSLKDALRSVLLSVVQAWQQIAAQDLGKALSRSMGGQNGGIGGLISAGMSWLGLADGGIVRGAGGPRSDLIPAYLSNNEAVLNADAVNYVGEDFINWLNWKSRRFANGGTASGRSSAMAPFTAPSAAVNILNQLGDDEVLSVLDTPKGRRVINNIIKAAG